MTFIDACEFVTKWKELSPEGLVHVAFAAGEQQGHKLPLRELHKWRDVFGLLGSTPDECGNAIHAKNDEYEEWFGKVVDAMFKIRNHIVRVQNLLITGHVDTSWIVDKVDSTLKGIPA